MKYGLRMEKRDISASPSRGAGATTFGVDDRARLAAARGCRRRPDRPRAGPLVTSTRSAVSRPSVTVARLEPAVAADDEHARVRRPCDRRPGPARRARPCACVEHDRRVGVHARHELERRVRHVHLDVASSACRCRAARRSARPCPVNVLLQRLHVDVDRRADVDARDRRFGHRNHQPQPVVLRQPDERHRLRLRRRAGLDHRAGVGVAMRDDAGKRRRDARVVEQRLRLALAGLRDLRAARCAAASAALAVATCASATRSRPRASSMSCCATRFGRAFMHARPAASAPRCATSCADSARSRSACARLISSLRALDAGFVLLASRPAAPGSRAPPAAGRP